MKLKKWILLAGAVLCFCSGCSKKDEKVEITRQKDRTSLQFSWWGDDHRHEYTFEGIKNFEERNANVRIKLKYGDWEGFPERMAVELASHTSADVMQIDYSWLKEYSPDGDGFYDISKLASYISINRYDSFALELGTVNGKLNAIPVSLNTPLFYWNQTLLQQYGLEAPDDWEQLFEMAEVLSKDDIYPLCASEEFIWYLCAAYTEQQSGRAAFDESGQPGFTEADIQSMIDFYSRLQKEHVVMQSDAADAGPVTEGKCAGALIWLVDADDYFKDAAESGCEMIAGSYLTEKNGKRFGWYVKPYCMYAISKDTQHVADSALLMNYLLSSEKMMSLQGLDKGVPVSSAAQTALQKNNLLEGHQYDGYLKMSENMESLQPCSTYLEDDAVISAFMEAADAVSAKTGTSAQAAKSLYAALQKTTET